jgi:hypothetical protein
MSNNTRPKVYTVEELKQQAVKLAEAINQFANNCFHSDHPELKTVDFSAMHSMMIYLTKLAGKKVFKIYSARDQGVFKKDELIGTLDDTQYEASFGNLDFGKVTTYGSNTVYITKTQTFKS